MKNLIRRDFTQIPNDLINDSTISRDARFLFVYLCSKPDDWKFYNSVICRELNCSDDSRRKYMNELASKGWISKVQLKNDKGEFKENDITLNPYPKFSDTVTSPHPKSSESVKDGIGKSPAHNNTIPITNTELFTNTEEISLPHQIINYLNEKRGGRGFEKTNGNLTPINARIKEKKYKFDDFKKVIDSAIIKWANDEKMKSYIRPETLFGSKFNAYLVEADDILQKAQVNNGSDNFVFEPTETAELK